MARKKSKRAQIDPATKNFSQGVSVLHRHPMFAPLLTYANLIRRQGNLCPEKAWAIVTNNGDLHCHPTRRGKPEEWTYVVAHCLLHLGFEHFQVKPHASIWNAACDRFIYRFLADLKLGKAPEEYLIASSEIARDEESWYRELSEKGLSPNYHGDLIFEKERPRYRQQNFSWSDCLGKGLTNAVTSAVDVAGGRSAYLGDTSSLNTTASLAQGLVYHHEAERGYLPAGLIEEIRALSQPPIPWDVELAKWFDNYFAPIVRVRSYARPSRRQAATPNIPRPRYLPDTTAQQGRTFGVVLDTSGSMDTKLLGKALGAIASYSVPRDVPWVRVVFCDAIAYDAGYLAPEDIGSKVQIKGRGGTVLQPGINLLEKAENFPKTAPLLIITDGYCDRLLIRREHAFLLPSGSSLPFVPKGEVFRIK